ncbi:hypothetical protein TSUD_146440 [Trifolium subterraneum]|uniref:Uncharacterized protein n=1 Tax=Trifolium subterraneum TaxID=3900 RepID=A0A2Z6MW32_TRISU|nr:hypothetical protein TSUD_146440 [Trifolium subterraneum]
MNYNTFETLDLEATRSNPNLLLKPPIGSLFQVLDLHQDLNLQPELWPILLNEAHVHLQVSIATGRLAHILTIFIGLSYSCMVMNSPSGVGRLNFILVSSGIGSIVVFSSSETGSSGRA